MKRWKLAPQDFTVTNQIRIGGPVDGSRGFVLHSQDHMQPESVAVTHEIGLTSSVNILRDITNGSDLFTQSFRLVTPDGTRAN